MHIGILGTGMVGRILAVKLLERGQQVSMGTRDVAVTLAKTGPDGMGQPPLSEWLRQNSGVELGNFHQAAQAEVLINATNGTGSLAALEAAGEAALEGKILLDLANPLDFSRGMPPTLSVKDTDSLAEQIQRRFPALRVVKTLNTMNVSLMVDPASLEGGDHTAFVSGNDETAKSAVVSYLKAWFGWREDRIFDLGDLSTARGTEMLLPLWLRAFFKLGNVPFQFKLVY